MMSYLDSAHYRLKLRQDQNVGASLLIEFDKVRLLLWLRNHTVVPHRLVAAIGHAVKEGGIEEFHDCAQSDAHEFLMFILDHFHRAVSREVDMVVAGSPKTDRDRLAKKCYEHLKNQFDSEWSEFVPMFTFVSVMSIQCPKSNEVWSSVADCSTVLSLQLTPEAKSVNELLDVYTEAEDLSGESAWHDDVNNLYKAAVKRTCFWSLPEVLIVHFVRWNQHCRKDKRLIHFPLDCLDMSKYVTGYRPFDYKYSLSGVCNHHGGHAGGHYTCFVRDIHGKWLLCNDAAVKPLESHHVCSQNAYILFYTKIK
tara:strand:- start:17226 stop:18152 length:927 start_codon:yes stop_codon:yes gene_type:complete